MLSRRQLSLIGVCIAILFAVHLTYIGFILPQAELALDQARAAGEAAPRTLFVVLKDLEQELCIVLALCCLVLMGEKSYRMYSQRYLFEVDLLAPEENEEEQKPTLSSLESLERDIRESPLVKTMMASIRRPSIGFVGTVRGIGAALSEADEALAGNIATMTENLGIAFNSTLVALMLSIGLTLALHLLQSVQDRLVIDIEDYCDRYLVKRLAFGPTSA